MPRKLLSVLVVFAMVLPFAVNVSAQAACDGEPITYASTTGRAVTVLST